MKTLLQYAAAIFLLICFGLDYFIYSPTYEDKLTACAFYGVTAMFGVWLSVVRIEHNIEDTSE